jgi:hypothetical protein
MKIIKLTERRNCLNYQFEVLNHYSNNLYLDFLSDVETDIT